MNNLIIRLELENMRETVVHALIDRNGEIAKAIQDEIDQQIAAFDFTSYVRQEVNTCIKGLVSNSLRRHLSYEIEGEIAKEVEKILASRIKEDNPHE